MTLHGLRSSRVLLPTGLSAATVLFEHGKVTALLPHDAALDARTVDVADVGNDVVFPGLVDCHVHINEPGRTEWEGFETATQAAAAGGVTTVIDMPLNSLPVTTTRDAFERKLEACEGKRHVDLGFWGGVVPNNVPDLSHLAKAGVLGCKTFLVDSGIDEFPNTTADDLRQAMPILRDHGLPLLVHAELDLGATVTEERHRVYQGFLQSRPKAWENQAIALMIELCRETRCPVHIVHLSSAEALPSIRAAKAEGLPLTVETCPHYLCLEAEQVPDGATEYKCAPPIREHDNREGLWRGLLDGVIDFVITDHSPCIPSLKLPELGDFMQAWGGIASLQLGLRAIWTEAHERGASLEQLAGWMCSGPARFAGLAHRKGHIGVGMDADFVVWAPEHSQPVVAPDLFFRHKVTPYLGRTLRGQIRRTILAGNEVFDGARPVGAAGGRVHLHRH